MPDVPLLSRAQMRRIEPLFPRARGLPRVDDRLVISGIVYVIRNGLQWKDAPHGRQPRSKRAARRCIGRTRGGLNSKLHVVCDRQGRPVAMLLTEGQTSDHVGAALLLDALPAARELIADRGYDSDRFRQALVARHIAPCIPSTRSRKVPLPHDRTLYRQRHRIENAFGRLKDWRRIATRYDRCAHTFFSAICIAAAITVWLT